MSSDEFEFIRGQPADYDEVLSFLCTYFLYEETMNVALRFTKEEFAPFVVDLVTDCLASGYTVLAREKKTGRLAGIVLNNIWRRGTSHGSESSKRPSNPTPSQIIEIFLDTFSRAFWELIPPNVEAVLHREILSVGSPWQRRGLGSRLIDEGFIVGELRQKGIRGFASKTSSLANQQLMAKKGYEELMSIPFKSVTGTDGRPLVVPQDGTTRNVLLWKRLE